MLSILKFGHKEAKEIIIQFPKSNHFMWLSFACQILRTYIINGKYASYYSSCEYRLQAGVRWDDCYAFILCLSYFFLFVSIILAACHDYRTNKDYCHKTIRSCQNMLVINT